MLPVIIPIAVSQQIAEAAEARVVQGQDHRSANYKQARRRRLWRASVGAVRLGMLMPNIGEHW
jgi:hypothetical protein